jgi:hypothetical protein
MSISARQTFRMTHYEILPPEQMAVLPRLMPTRRNGFVLYGGTAIALQLGHRESVDFDFFSDQELNEQRLRESMPILEDAVTTQREPNTWTMNVKPKEGGQAVKLSFFGGFNFGRVGNPVPTSGQELVMASLDDLLGHKLKVLLNRVEAKDYMDIAAMLSNGQKLEDGLGAATALFKSFPAAESLRALTYFAGGDLERLTQSEKNILTTSAAKVNGITPAKVLSSKLGLPSPMHQGQQNGLDR